MFPAYFIAHGAPTLILEDSEYTRFLQTLPSRFPRPRAVMVFTAHWESPVQRIGAPDQFDMIYDFSGFPEALYRVIYPARGDVKVAEEVRTLLGAASIPASIDRTRGLDHGAWTVLGLLFPKADVPVVALSVNPLLSPEQQYNLGRALASLRRDVLILGSGGTVHNLWALDWERGTDGPAAPWAIVFDNWLMRQLEGWNTEALFRYETEAPHARRAVPRNEHFIPLLLAMGAADDTPRAKRLVQFYQYGSLSLACWEFGGKE